MNELDQKINTHFPGLVVRKDLVKTVKGNAIVPSYVLEYLLGQYCATSDEPTIQTGIETVKEILAKHYVHRNEAGLVRSNIKEKGRYKVIDKISVDLNDKKDVYQAQFSNLGLKEVLVDSGTVKKHPKLLVGGVWCIADLEYEFTEDKSASPWILSTLKPIQLSHFDFDGYVEARKQFTTDEWIDLLVQSIGFNPEMFGKRSKLTQLVRLIPFCERNYNLIELGPKGTGKSHIYSEFSPHGILISGGEVTVTLRAAAGQVLLTVADSGVGIPPEQQAHLFDGYLEKLRMPPPPQGLGLGLPLDEAMRRLLHFIGSRPLVGYYLEFDVAMLNRAVVPILGLGLPQRRIEVSALYHDYKFAQLPPHHQQGNVEIDLRFTTLLADLALPQREAHDALNDAVMAAMAFTKLRHLVAV